MGSFICMLKAKNAGITEDKRQEFEEKLEKLFNASGMMYMEPLHLYGKDVPALRPVKIENGYTTCYYNWFEDDTWENVGYGENGVYSGKVGWLAFGKAAEAAYIFQTLYMSGPAFVFRDGNMVIPWEFLGWFRYLFGTDYKLPDRDLMRLAETLHEQPGFSFYGIEGQYCELICSGYMPESIVDAIAVMYGTESALNILGDDDEKPQNGIKIKYGDCIWKINRLIENFKNSSEMDEEQQVQYLMAVIQKLAETDAFEKGEDWNVESIRFFLKITGNYAFATKKIAELYEKEFWQLYEPFIGRERQVSIFHENWIKGQEDLIGKISTAEFFHEDADDMTYFWKADKKLDFSEEAWQWFANLKEQFDIHMEESQPIPKMTKYIIDDLDFANRNYLHIYVFAEFFEETLDNIQDLRYQAVWHIFHDMVHDPDILRDGICIQQKENTVRRLLRRFLGLVANTELRREIFGF